MKKIEDDLLKLPREVRAHLVEVLRSSLEDEEAEIADAWHQEAHRRYQQIVSGEVETISAEDSLAKLRARIRR